MKSKHRSHYRFGAKKFTHGIVENWLKALSKIRNEDSFFVSRRIYDLLIFNKIECFVYRLKRHYRVRGG